MALPFIASIARLLCRFGWHDYHVLAIRGEFLAGRQCRRCGHTIYFESWRHMD